TVRVRPGAHERRLRSDGRGHGSGRPGATAPYSSVHRRGVLYRAGRVDLPVGRPGGRRPGRDLRVRAAGHGPHRPELRFRPDAGHVHHIARQRGARLPAGRDVL
ncbi:MAG: hypothetical protein AVDCRST_MAG70-575, partial [uncultured Thermomicrobiales bacterium]